MVREVAMQGHGLREFEEEKKLSSAPLEEDKYWWRSFTDLYDDRMDEEMPGHKPDNRTQSELALHGATIVSSWILISMFIAGFLPTTQGYFDSIDVAWFFWE